MAIADAPTPVLGRASDADRVVRDLGSRNGTRLNRIRVKAETEVRPGDVR